MDYNFRKYQPLPLRLWHWFTVLVVFGLLATGGLRMTVLSGFKNSKLIEAKLQQTGTVIAPELAREIANAIRDPMWDWHIYFGFTLAALFATRGLIAAVLEKKCPGEYAVRCILGLKNVKPEDKTNARHYTVAKIGQALFYFATLLMVLTGLLVYFKETLGLTKNVSGIFKEVHEVLMWFIVVFIVGHIFGLVREENGRNSGLISNMINGGDPKLK